MTSVVKMSAINRLDSLLSDIIRSEPTTSSNGISEATSTEPVSRLTLTARNSYPSQELPTNIVTNVPLPPRRSSSALKTHRRHHHHPHLDSLDNHKQYQPLLNSSTLDDLFRALTLECEQYLAAANSHQNKIYDQMIVNPISKIQVAAESNDDDYENLQTRKPVPSIKTSISPLKTSIQVISPIKRHVVSITITSKVSTPQLASPTKVSCNATTSTQTPIVCQSSEDDAVNLSSSSTCRKRRRRARKQIVSLNPTRSSSSSNERKEIINEKKPIISKRSCSTDPRHQRTTNSYDNDFISYSSSQKQRTKRPHRRDVSLQHSFPITERFHKNHSSPLSVLLTSPKVASDFLDNSQQRQPRRSRLEATNQKPSTLLDRMHQQLYRPPSTRNNNTKTIIPTHRMPSYPVY